MAELATVVPATPNPIIRQLRNLLVKGQVVEIRVPKGGKDGTISGFFDNGKDLAAAAEALSGKYKGVYFTLNPVKPELLARSPNKLTYNADRNTLAKDTDIVSRRWMLIDTDPIRPADVGSTEAEHDAAMNLAALVRAHLAALSWPDPIVADSGNGAHLLYRVDLPNDEEARLLIRGVLRRLGKDHDTDLVKIDRKVFNASRICKTYGTIAAKGDNTEERPHRLSAIISAPADIQVVPRELLEAMQPPPEEAKPTPAASNDNRLAPAMPSSGTSRYALSALDRGCRKIASAGSGTRNDTLNEEAFGLFQLVYGGELGEYSTWAAIEQSAIACGLDAGEIKSTMLSAQGAARNSPRKAPEPRQRPQPPQRPGPRDLPPNIDPETGEVLDAPPMNVDTASGFEVYERDTFPAEAPLADYLFILGRAVDGKTWIRDRRGNTTKPYTSADLLKRANLLDLAPLEAWDAAIRVAEPNSKFSPDAALSMIAGIAKSIPEFVTNEKPQREAVTADEAEERAGFTILGYDRDELFVFPFEAKQLRAMTKSDMTETGLFSIAPMEFWLDTFPAKIGFDKSRAVDWLFRVAYRRGVFNADRVRGRGAWRDEKRIVFHMGDRMHVSGEYKSITEMTGRYIYQAERPFPNFDDVEPLSDDEGKELLNLAGMFRWRVPASAALMPGFCLLAPLCGALNWRPHIWITGGAGSGKSTILEKFVHPLMAAIDVYAQGNSTEAGLRQAIRGDAVPVLFDESEQNDEGETKRMQAVLSLIRQSSSESGARTLKGTVAGKGMNFHIRSMFCLASIQVGIQHQADRERLTVLALRDKEHDSTAGSASDRWEEIKAGLYSIERDPDYAKRLIRRSIDMFPVILETVDVFVKAAAQHFGNQRTGDQYGTLLAGAWCLLNRVKPSHAEAIDWINQYDWHEYTDPANVNESEQALRALLDAKVRTPRGTEVTIYDILERIAFITGVKGGALDDDGFDQPSMDHLSLKEAQAVLMRVGMKVVKSVLYLSNNSQALTSLVRHTKYAADLRGVLSRLDGVTKDGGVQRINGTTQRCMAIPLDILT